MNVQIVIDQNIFHTAINLLAEATHPGRTFKEINDFIHAAHANVKIFQAAPLAPDQPLPQENEPSAANEAVATEKSSEENPDQPLTESGDAK